MVPATVAGKYIIRFGVNAANITKEDIGSFRLHFVSLKTKVALFAIFEYCYYSR